MKRFQKVDVYDPVIYPRLLFVATELEGLDDKFEFLTINYKHDDGGAFNRLISSIDDNPSGAITCPVIRKSDNKYGVIVIILDLEEIDSDVIPHESVHVADYIYEQLGIYTTDFSEGNEHYAYLVGWAAGCISKTVSNRLKDRAYDN